MILHIGVIWAGIGVGFLLNSLRCAFTQEPQKGYTIFRLSRMRDSLLLLGAGSLILAPGIRILWWGLEMWGADYRTSLLILLGGVIWVGIGVGFHFKSFMCAFTAEALLFDHSTKCLRWIKETPLGTQSDTIGFDEMNVLILHESFTEEDGHEEFSADVSIRRRTGEEWLKVADSWDVASATALAERLDTLTRCGVKVKVLGDRTWSGGSSKREKGVRKPGRCGRDSLLEWPFLGIVATMNKIVLVVMALLSLGAIVYGLPVVLAGRATIVEYVVYAAAILMIVAVVSINHAFAKQTGTDGCSSGSSVEGDVGATLGTDGYKLPKFKVGGLYSVKDGETRFKIAKVLVVDKDAVHIRLYKNTFATRPDKVEPSILSLGSIKDKDGFGIGHLPLMPQVFAAGEPMLLMETEVTPQELEGYKMWKEGGGGAFT